MAMAVVRVREMRVGVPQGLVLVPVGLLGVLRHGLFVVVVVVLVMDMLVLVPHRFVCVLMVVSFGEVAPDTECHQATREKQLRTERLAEQRDREQCTEERATEKYAPVRAVPS